jgi:hypothetical protein
MSTGVVMLARRRFCSITISATTNNSFCHWNCWCCVLLICVITCDHYSQCVTLKYCKRILNILFKCSNQIALNTSRVSFCELLRCCSDVVLFVLKLGLVKHPRWPLCTVSHWWKP